MALSTTAIITLAELKTYLKIGASTYDTELEQLIESASAMVENYISRCVVARAITNERHDMPYQGNIISLRNFPVTVMPTVRSGADNSSEGSTVDSTGYRVNKRTGVITFDYKFADDIAQYFSVDYTAGIAASTATVPYDLKMAAFLICANAYSNKSGLKSESMGSYSYTMGDLVGGLNSTVVELLGRYRYV